MKLDVYKFDKVKRMHWFIYTKLSHIVLEGKLMCWNKVVCFITTNSPLKIDFLELHMEILMQKLFHSYKNYAVVKVSLYQKIISLKTCSWLQSCKITGQEGACFDYNRAFSKWCTCVPRWHSRAYPCEGFQTTKWNCCFRVFEMRFIYDALSIALSGVP